VPRSKIQLDPKFQASLKDASLKLTGVKKRAFIAQATLDYFYDGLGFPAIERVTGVNHSQSQ
jgi:hypothetical protein